MRTYGRLLRGPSTALSLLAALLSAVPIGMWPLTVVLLALARGEGAGEAGLLAAVFGIGNATGVVAQGALLLRMRAALLLPVFALLGAPAALLLGLPGPASVAGALLAGLAIPAVTPAVRGRFATVLPGDDRPSAYALVNVLFQVGIATGPVVAAALATPAASRWAPPLAAGCGLLSAALLAVAHRGAARPRRSASPGAWSVPSRRSLAGVTVLIACAAAAGFGIGVLQVVVPVLAGAGVSGAAFAALALAEVAGAIALGTRARLRHAMPMLVAGGLAMAAVYLAIATGTAPIVLLAVLLGAATATQSLGSALTLDRFVTPRRLPAVFSAQIAALVLASSAGAFTAGREGTAAAVVAVGALAGGAVLAAAVLATSPGRAAAAR